MYLDVCVVGAGYVGLVTAACFADMGHRVTCTDLNTDIIDAIKLGDTHIYEPGLLEIIKTAQKNNRLKATNDLGHAISGADVSLICVGTPFVANRIDLSQVANAVHSVAKNMYRAKPDHVVIMRSTVIPGTTDNLVIRALQEAGYNSPTHHVAMNPEFLREGTAIDDFMNPSTIVIGSKDPRAAEVVKTLYAPITKEAILVTPKEAELIKYATNAFCSMLISFSNEIASICEDVDGLNESIVLGALRKDKRLSPVCGGSQLEPAILTYLKAGIGYGGSCFPKDTIALADYARQNSTQAHLLDAVTKTHLKRPGHVADMLSTQTNGLNGRHIAVLGLAYKPDTDDVRNSPSITFIKELLRRGANVSTYDPIAIANARSILGDRVTFSGDLKECVTGKDAVFIGTAWGEFTEQPWPALIKKLKSPIVFDGRGILIDVEWPLGVRYQTVGHAASSPPSTAG